MYFSTIQSIDEKWLFGQLEAIFSMDDLRWYESAWFAFARYGVPTEESLPVMLPHFNVFVTEYIPGKDSTIEEDKTSPNRWRETVSRVGGQILAVLFRPNIDAEEYVDVFDKFVSNSTISELADTLGDYGHALYKSGIELNSMQQHRCEKIWDRAIQLRDELEAEEFQPIADSFTKWGSWQRK